MNHPQPTQRVCAVIVTYHPGMPLLEKSLQALLPQVEGAVIVDNTPAAEADPALARLAGCGKAVLLANGENLGVGAAQNLGIAWARGQGFSHVLLMDHDSVPAPDMVAQLSRAGTALAAQGTAVAAVGPRAVNLHTGLDMHYVRFGMWGFEKIWCPPGTGAAPIPVDFLLSSGSLITMEVLDAVGGLEDGLFIDHVDTEWYLRARGLGYRAFGVCDARLSHKFSEGSTRVWLGYWRQLPRHNPLRHYYTFRNSLLLYRRPYAPWRWILNDIVRLAKISAYYCLVVPPRLEQARMIARGVWDGLRGKTGKGGG